MGADRAEPAEGQEFACWLCEPYGVPCETSEVSRIAAYYRVECLTVCAAGCMAVEAAEVSVRRADA
jgi:hypothetical protein